MTFRTIAAHSDMGKARQRADRAQEEHSDRRLAVVWDFRKEPWPLRVLAFECVSYARLVPPVGSEIVYAVRHRPRAAQRVNGTPGQLAIEFHQEAMAA